MNRTRKQLRTVSGSAISLTGLALASVLLYDVYVDVVFQNNVLYTTLFENSLPLLLNAGTAAAGYWLVKKDEPVVVRQTLVWTLLGIVGVLLLAAWVYYFQLVQGQIKPRIIVAQLASLGAVAGVINGVYHGREKRRKQQTSALFENASDCIVKVRFRGDVPYVQDVNPAFERTFGFAGSEIRNEPLDQNIVPGDEASADEINRRAIEGERIETKVERKTANGETRTFRLQGIPIHSGGSNASGYAVYTDITESEQYTDRLDALHEATRDLLSAETPEEVARRGVDAASQVLKLPMSGVFFSAGDALEPAALSDSAEERFGQVGSLDEGESIAWDVFESSELAKIDDVRRLESRRNPETPVASEMVVPLRDHGVLIVGSPRGSEFDANDFTLAEILGSNIATALDRVSRERELEDQNERLETFASVVSHDLKNPLSVAAGYTELAREEFDDSEELARTADALDRMDALIEDLLTIARQEEAIEHTERVELDALARDAWETAKTGDATLEVADSAELTVSRSRCRQLFENLFRNAVEHGGEAVTVTVGPLDGAGFFVEDTGSGIPDDQRAEVFEHGYTTSDGGTGLGLAIVEEIAEAHGGSVAVTESEAGGARFEVEDIDDDA
ncbi:MAG: ATP-binding protein [Halolamina sp.]